MAVKRLCPSLSLLHTHAHTLSISLSLSHTHKVNLPQSLTLSHCLSRWTDSKYKGKTYLPLSSLADKVVTAKGERDEQKIPSGTWAASPSPSLSPSHYSASQYGTTTDNDRNREGYSRNQNPFQNEQGGGGVSKSNSYPYPHPSPYSQYRNSTGALSHSSSSSRYENRYSVGGGDRGGGDGLDNYISPFPYRDQTAPRKSINESN